MRVRWGMGGVVCAGAAAVALAGCVERLAPYDGGGDAMLVGGHALYLTATPYTPGSFTMTVTGLEPGETTRVFRSPTEGHACPPKLGGNCLDLATPSHIGSGVADATGTATVGINVPQSALGLTMWFQAVAVRGAGGVDSVVSNPIDGTFAPPSFLSDEDFESGDLASFPYVNSDPFPWAIESAAGACHGGSFCMRTNPSQPLDEVSSISVPMSVRQDGSISFWASTHTEPGQHFFRFYIDGVLELELSGDTPWTEYTYAVTATGANGADRVFTWEYTRSTFMDATHVPWNTVWVDDIDFPKWNTQPGVPEMRWPGDAVLVDQSPTFQWHADDPDFDAITYELQYDTDPAFPHPISSGETYEIADDPNLADGLWFWRVRSKDNSDYRWSAWSPTRSVDIDSAAEYPLSWDEQHGAQFATDALDGAAVSGDAIIEQIGATNYATGLFDHGGTIWTRTLSNLPPTGQHTGTLQICVTGDFDNSGGNEYVDYVQLDGVTVYAGNWYPFTTALTCTNLAVDPSSYVADGSTTIQIAASVDVGSGWDASATLTYATEISADVVSKPIAFADVDDGAATVWDKVQWVGAGATVRVLDGAGVLIPDADLPGNAAGFTGGTVHLFDVDPAVYPVLRLSASLADGSGRLDRWRVVANDRFEWTFAMDGDEEGWVAVDSGVTPTLATANHVLRFDSPAGGLDPRIELVFPQPLDAARFSTLEMRLRTSNNYINDDPTLYWASNFGAFDARRSIVDPDVFLFAFTDTAYDLTAVPVAPDEPWQGMVEAIRLDPVIAFVDELGLPDAGWVEIESISLR